MKRAFSGVAIVASLLAACGGGGATRATPSPTPWFDAGPCGAPPPVASPWLNMAYPEPNATHVPVSIGLLVFAGSPTGFYGTGKVNMQSSSGSSVPVGAYTSPPSPLPTPFATPATMSGNIPYVAVPIPTLSPSTTYTLSFTYTDFNGIPPACTGPVTQPLGSFST